MNKDIVSGQAKQAKSKVEEAAGKLTGNKSQEIEGKAEQATGKVHEQYGRLKEISTAIGE